ncbi:hypothetical protein BOX15_Mlig009742g2 [Macrostomum lignano]|uniref:Uncharacterized protein n=1 Tax=Macrostomum lignano TaxID=282301 RepID=A0A267DEL2_9PLAT|nr:hypothetical protein BOX15_Mlig009742g3 [Macrostomum lignano]PAA49057.1 hypothetical protein BOX15_Mlig009742g2 [Macrostomum lignano]
MSGRQLPDHFARSAASHCASQLADTAPVTPTFYAAKWCQQPGFLDPFEVVYLCIRRLRQATYVNVRYYRHCGEKVANKTCLCPGIELYIQEMRPDSQVQQDLAEHISRGSVSHLKFVIGKYRLDQVLLFLMKYLRERGPLLRINYTSLEHLQQTCCRSVTLAKTHLTGGQMHEFEFESFAALGSYLSDLLTIACSHDLFWMTSHLAELWGPLLVDFVNVSSQLSETLAEDQLTERRISFMARLLEAMPWDSLKWCESLRLTLGPEPDRNELLRSGVERSRQMASLQERPLALAGISTKSVCDILDGKSGESDSGVIRDSRYLDALNEKLLMDELAQVEERKSQLEREARNKDYSSEYMYSKEYRAIHAPHGMCKSGV